MGSEMCIRDSNETGSILRIGERSLFSPAPDDATVNGITTLMITQNPILEESSGTLLDLINSGPVADADDLEGIVIECRYTTQSQDAMATADQVSCAITGGGFNIGCGSCTSISSSLPVTMMSDNRFNAFTRTSSDAIPSFGPVFRFESFRLAYD